jgi:PilZ domain-containing protein
VTGPEKRQHHRFLARLDVRVVSGEKVAPGGQVVTVDIGVGGARCVSNAAFDANARLQLTIALVGGDLPEPVNIPVDAVVLRCTPRPHPHRGYPFEIALQFVRLDARERRTLQGYLNSL